MTEPLSTFYQQMRSRLRFQVAVVKSKRLSPEARRQQILEMATRAFAENGLVKTKHTDVAALAEVSDATVFHYFPTLENLQSAVLKQIHTYFFTRLIAPQVNKDNPGYEKIEQILVAFRKVMDVRPDYVVIWLEWSGFTRGHCWELYLEFYRDATKAIKQLLRQGKKDGSVAPDLNQSDAARVVMGMAHTIVYMQLSGSSERTIRKNVHSLVMAYLAPKKHL